MAVSRSGYYRWLSRSESATSERKRELEALLKETYKEFEAAYGAPRITQELNALGHKCSLNFIAKIMRENGILARNGKAFNYGGHALTMSNVADNLLWRSFQAD